jgi:hypothetical protein
VYVLTGSSLPAITKQLSEEAMNTIQVKIIKGACKWLQQPVSKTTAQNTDKFPSVGFGGQANL